MFTSLALVLFATVAQQQSACEGLKNLSLPKTTITAAEFRTAGAQPARGGRGGGAQLPAHCRVAAVLAPSSDSHIEMELWLPAENWNGKFLAVGNGGWAGNIETGAMGTALARGYATASNDTGHNRTNGPDAAFAIGHPEKVIDFGYRAMHEMAVQSKAMINAFYRQSPRLSYYQGCSTGGRQGLMEAQRYPEDFDAIIAGAPVNNMVHLNTSQTALFTRMLKEPASILPAPKIKLLADAVMNACDAQDGVKDSLISNPQMCKFEPATLLCKAGDGADCLTAPQVENVRRTAFEPFKNAKGELIYPARSRGFESGLRMATPGAPIGALYSDMNRAVGRQNPNWDQTTFDFETDMALALKNAVGVEANDPDLTKFKARGGKLLLWHGYADPGPAPENTINYQDAVIKKLGGGKQDDWMRTFLLPGVAHCGGGTGPDQADYLTAMEKWREGGTAPASITAARRDGSMSRPLCPYPQVAKYSGSGDANVAANFTCAAP